MAIHDLSQTFTKHGKASAVWYDDEEAIFVVQYEFFQIAFSKHEFEAFLETLEKAKERFKELKL